MKRPFLALWILSLSWALICGCSTAESGKQHASIAPAPVQPAPPSQAAAPSTPPVAVYTPAVAVSGSAEATTTEQNRIVEFRINAPDATKAYLAGEFNGWSETDLPMTKQANGDWTASVALKPGHYQYKFIVDDKWTPDPKNPDKTDDGYGGFNSVVNVPESGNAQ